MRDNLDELVNVALAHASAEAADDPVPVLETLETNCVYELQPVGLIIEGQAAARRYYDYFFTVFRPLVEGYASGASGPPTKASGRSTPSGHGPVPRARSSATR